MNFRSVKTEIFKLMHDGLIVFMHYCIPLDMCICYSFLGLNLNVLLYL